jgi:hypothetical protein
LTNKGSQGGNTGARPTKAQRQEEARLKRLEIEREMAARTRNRKIGIALVVAAIVAVVAVVTFLPKKTPSTAAGTLPTMSALLSQGDAAAKTAGCDTVVETPNYNNAGGADPLIDHAHIGVAPALTEPALSTYPTTPPVSGPHANIPPGPLSAGIYDAPPDVYRAIHTLEHAGVVIWYSPAIASSPELARIKEFYSQTANVGQSKVVIAPYDYPGEGGQLPKGIEMALAGWHRLQSCSAPSLAAAFAFASQYENPPAPGRTYVGVAREATSAI